MARCLMSCLFRGLPFLVIVSHNLVSPLIPDSDCIIVRGAAIMIMRTRA
jgi:hypothetical protein